MLVGMLAFALLALMEPAWYDNLVLSEGEWLSRLERTVHIREVTGSNPVSPTPNPLRNRCASLF